MMKQAEQTTTRLKAICQETDFGFPKIISHQRKTKDQVATITKRLADINQLLQNELMTESRRCESTHIYLLSFILPMVVLTTMFVGDWTTSLGITIPPPSTRCVFQYQRKPFAKSPTSSIP